MHFPGVLTHFTFTWLLGFAYVSNASASAVTNDLANHSNHPSATSELAAIFGKRASSDAPDGYAPKAVDCPSNRPSIRQASSLSPEEIDWLPKRRNNTMRPLRDLLSRMDIVGLDTNSYMDTIGDNATLLPNIGIGFSGGGYRALLNGAGALAAFDDRTSGSKAPGHLGGLLQSATYIAGLSGGSWLLGSVFTNNFTSVEEILSHGEDDDSIWQFEMAITKGPEDGLISTASYLKGIVEDVTAKREAGFNTSLTDVWGRALSFQLISPTDGGPGYTFSSIRHDTDFSSGRTPMPIFVADGRTPGQLVIDGNATVYEINPWELGTFDPTTFAFAPLEYVGSKFSNGELSPSEACIRGFDNAGYIMGTSSSLFNQGLLQFQEADGKMAKLLTRFLEDVDEEENDVANYPNPFYGVNPASSQVHDERSLTLVDGGEDLQNLPLHPLTQPERGLDVIFAIDSSADTLEANGDPNWPNGTALIATYARSLLPIANGTSFPIVPDANTFVNLGLNNRPTFFGCDAENTTTPTPLIVYIPNAPYAYHSNVSTFKMEYSSTERNNIIQNGYDVATMGNGTSDPQWNTCVGCAILHRSFGKTQTAVPDVCAACFRQYCWNGTVAASEATYSPKMKLQPLEEDESETSSAMALRSISWYGVLAAVVVATSILY